MSALHRMFSILMGEDSRSVNEGAGPLLAAVGCAAPWETLTELYGVKLASTHLHRGLKPHMNQYHSPSDSHTDPPVQSAHKPNLHAYLFSNVTDL